MVLAYLAAAVVAIALAVWLQRTTPMARGYAWLSRLGAAVFALLFVPTLASGFELATLSQAVVLTCLPLVAVPYQVRMMRFIEGARASRPASRGPSRGPGGGRVRPRGRRRR